MNWLPAHRRSAWICGITLLFPLLLFVNALSGLLGLRHAYQSDIDSLIPRVARLQGLIGHEKQLGEASAKSEEEVAKLLYPASRDSATVSAELQTSVRQILVDAGLTVSNSQVLPVREKENLDYISIRLTVDGELSGLAAALTGFAEFRPLLLVESLEMKPVRAATKNDEGQKLTATLQLLSFRAIL